ncbi:MAG: hypothetical protein P1V97_24340, partial [Planctomycetota bacterium]|nr:hypothetical protein [Planctomycetota bacterium]
MNKFIESLRGYCFIAPNFFGFALFTALPVLGAIYMSFHQGTFSTHKKDGQWQVDAEFVGLKNYTDLLGFRSVDVLGTVTYDRGEAGQETLTIVSNGAEKKAPITLASLKAAPKASRVDCVSPQMLFFCGEVSARELDPKKIVEVVPDDASLFQATDSKFWFYLYNTAFFMIGIPLGMACSLGLAVLLNQKIKGRMIYRTLLFLPSVATGVAMFLVWRWIFNPNVG